MTELENCDKMVMMKMNNYKITVTKTIIKTSKQFISTALFKG